MRTALTGLVLVAVAFLCGVASGRAQVLPLGDGHVSDHPEAGHVFSCRSTLRGGGARHDGPWIEGSTWDPDRKPHVMGDGT